MHENESAQARAVMSHRAADMRISAIKEMSILSAQVEGAVSLAWGLPSFQTPVHIRDAVAAAMQADPDVGKYTLPGGLPELRRLAADNHFAKTGVRVNPDHEVMISAGNMQGLNTLFHMIVDDGDEVIVTDPGFPSHIQQIRLCGGRPIFWPLREDLGWSLDVERLRDLVSPRTKAIVLVSPCNPTGSIFSERELMAVGRVARERGVLVLIDDPYSHFLYENADSYFNLASAPGMRNHLAYLFTFSKAHAMSGWRLGYMVLPPALKASAIKVHDATMICAPRISQAAGIAALSQPPVHLREFEQTLAQRRELICQRLDRLPHVFQYVKPQGAYYVFPEIVAKHDTSKEFALRLLEQAKVTVTPGSGFGPSGENHVRMAFCVCEDDINLAFDRIEDCFGR